MTEQEPPTLAGMSLHRCNGAACSGAAFELQGAARESETVVINDWEAEVSDGTNLVVVRGGTAGDYHKSLTVGLAYAQKALDIMSLRGGNDLLIKGFEDDHLVWWGEPSGLVIRIVSLAPLRMDVPPVNVTVTDQAGNTVPPTPAPKVEWHESFRYFRLSQTTDDLFDAYRNAYLALESVLSSIAPQQKDATGKVAEGEGAWFKRALAQADQAVKLSSFVPPGTADPVLYLFDELYVSMRSAMSHAKSGRKVLLPQDERERSNVTASLRRLVSLYLKLAEAHLKARRTGGGVFAGAFRMMVSPTLERMAMYVSDDESPVNASDTSPNPGGGAMKLLTPMGVPDASEPFAVTRLWSSPCSDLSDLPFVRRAVGLIDDTLGMAQVLEGRLVLGSASRLEVMLGARGSNTRLPRERYSY